jgi:hypothetical protein
MFFEIEELAVQNTRQRNIMHREFNHGADSISRLLHPSVPVCYVKAAFDVSRRQQPNFGRPNSDWIVLA